MFRHFQTINNIIVGELAEYIEYVAKITDFFIYIPRLPLV